MSDPIMNLDDDTTFCTETETCCKFKDETDFYEDSIVIESNDILKNVGRKCGKRNFIGMESRISDGETAQYGELNGTNSIIGTEKPLTIAFLFQPNSHG